MQQYFYELADFLHESLHANEHYTAWLSAERSDFVRFNHGRVRQAGEVLQNYLTLRLVKARKQLSATLTLSGHSQSDRARLTHELRQLREILADVAPDPHLLLNEGAASSEHRWPARLPPAEAMVEELLATAEDRELVGFLARGPIYNGYASSFGQRDWHESTSFSMDWSLYGGGHAVKNAYAGTEWQRGTLREKIQDSARQLELLQRPAKTLRPGDYRAYLTAAALEPVINALNMGGFSEQALRSGRSPLLQLSTGKSRLHEDIHLSEDNAHGLAPAFQSEGFTKPEQVTLIESGRMVATLIAPRTARQHGLTTNGANQSEAAQSLRMAPGALPREQALSALDTGLFISNLWYLNYSDRTNAQLTGMTRFATFWAENGELVAPLAVMRFDDSIYRMLGEKLEALTQEREFIADTASYERRHTGSRLLPGALLSEFRLVL